MAQVNKRKVMTGIGDGYFEFMETEDTKTSGPVYDGKVQIVPSLENIEAESSFDSNGLFLSNKKHSDMGKMSDVTLTVNAAYLPEGFAEKAEGAIELSEGVYGYGDTPVRPFFRFAFPATDEDGGIVVYNFPKCQLEPVGVSGATETDTKEAQIPAYNIIANGLVYVSDIKGGSYFKADLRNETAAKNYDVDKLLEQGFYDKASLEKAKKDSPSELSDPVL